MKKLICSFALTVLFVFYSSHSFAETVLFDTVTGNTSTSEIYYWGGGASTSYGQQFRPNNNISVSSISVYMRKSSSSDSTSQTFKGHIYQADTNGVITGESLAQTNALPSTLNTTMTEVSAEFISPANLIANTNYIVLFNTSGYRDSTDDMYRWLLTNVVNNQLQKAWWSNATDGLSSGILCSGQSFCDGGIALRIYGAEEEVAVATTCAGTGPNCKDLTYWEAIEYFGLTPVFTLFPGPNSPVSEPTVFIGIDSFVSFDKG